VLRFIFQEIKWGTNGTFSIAPVPVQDEVAFSEDDLLTLRMLRSRPKPQQILASMSSQTAPATDQRE
jgi:hypothetical protein